MSLSENPLVKNVFLMGGLGVGREFDKGFSKQKLKRKDTFKWMGNALPLLIVSK